MNQRIANPPEAKNPRSEEMTPVPADPGRSIKSATGSRKKQIDKLWGEDGPYSEADLSIQMRILDDQVSRIFINVEVKINPFTFEFIKKHRDQFKDNPMIQQLLDHAEYHGQSVGYVSCVFEDEFVDKGVMERAQQHLDYARETIVLMHKFVMDYLGISKTPRV